MKPLALFMGAAAVLLASAASAQDAANTDMEILMQKVKADKKLLVASNMNLSDLEGKNFWPLYDSFQKELEKVNRQIAKVIQEYVEAYKLGPVPNDLAKKLMNDAFAAEEAELKLKRSYAEKLANVLPQWKAVRYIQIENKISAAVKVKLAEQIPLAY